MKKGIAVLIVVLLVSSSGFCSPSSSELNFVSASEWAKELLREAIESGVVTQDVIGMFDENITREDFIELIIALDDKLNNRKEFVEQLETPFTDVNNISVTRAFKMGVINGVGNGKFAPNDFLNREQMAVIYAKYFQLAMNESYEEVTPNQFKDYGEISQWARGSIGICCENGILEGVGSAMFDPQGIVSREIGIIGINKLYKKIQTEETPQITKVEDVQSDMNISTNTEPSGYKIKIADTGNADVRYSYNEEHGRYYVLDRDNQITTIDLILESYAGINGETIVYTIQFENSSLLTTEQSFEGNLSERMEIALSDYGTYTVNSTVTSNGGSQQLNPIRIYYHPESSQFSIGIKTYKNSNIDQSFTDKCGTDGRVAIEVQFDRVNEPTEIHYLQKPKYDDFESDSYATYQIPLANTVGVENIKSIMIYKENGDAWRPESFAIISEKDNLIAETQSMAWVEKKYLPIYLKGEQIPPLKQDIIGLQICTSSKSKSGTDDKIFAKVYFDDKSSRWLQLDKEGDDFEKGDTETYIFNLGRGRLVSSIERITIYSERNDQDDWRPEYAKVITDLGEILAYSNIDAIIDTSEYEIYNASKINQTRDKTVEVIVYAKVADKKNAGTDDGIYLDFYYSGETSSYPIKLDTDRYNDFERNSSKEYKIFMKQGKGFEDANYIDLRNAGADGVLIEHLSIKDSDGNYLVNKYLSVFVDASKIEIFSK